MPTQRQKHTIWIEDLFLEGKDIAKIEAITGYSKDVITGIIYRGRRSGKIPRPVYEMAQPYEERRNSYIRKGTITQVMERLNYEQRAHLTDAALRIGCNNLAEMIAAYVLDQLAEEMGDE